MHLPSIKCPILILEGETENLMVACPHSFFNKEARDKDSVLTTHSAAFLIWGCFGTSPEQDVVVFLIFEPHPIHSALVARLRIQDV